MSSDLFAAGLDDAVFYSQGCNLLGGFYRGAGEGPRPTVVLLHGVPGVEKNLDIAYALRDEGWNCLYFHYRGCWGSEGDYSFSGALEDAAAAIDWVVDQPSVDAEKLAVVGNSFGGYLAFAAAATDPRIKAAVSITPLIDPSAVALPGDLFDEFARMLHGVNGSELREQWNELPPVPEMSSELRSRPMLLITADRDEIFPISHYQAVTAGWKELTWVRIAGADHVFSNSRTALVRRNVDWLIENLGR